DSFLADIWEMFGYLPQTHLPTLAMSVFALVLMLGLQRVKALSKPSVLIAVVVTTAVSAMIGFEHKTKGKAEHFADPQAQALVTEYMQADEKIATLAAEITERSGDLREVEKSHDARTAADLRHAIELM